MVPAHDKNASEIIIATVTVDHDSEYHFTLCLRTIRVFQKPHNRVILLRNLFVSEYCGTASLTHLFLLSKKLQKTFICPLQMLGFHWSCPSRLSGVMAGCD